MEEFKGTKTEWHAVEFAGFIILKDSDFYEGKNILDYSDVGEVVANANAKLAKHSYELLEMLIRFSKINSIAREHINEDLFTDLEILIKKVTS